uniref:Uncharacterized protein n=1 Tax=Romanomermis culicivorax TaxID=13658 RepID=A0A915KGU5_ROMCU
MINNQSLINKAKDHPSATVLDSLVTQQLSAGQLSADY